MGDSTASTADTAILTLDTSSANEVLYTGKAVEQKTGLECDLTVTARWAPKQDVHWRAEFDRQIPELLFGGPDELTFTLQESGYAQGTVIDEAHVARWIPDGMAVSGWLDSGQVVGLADQRVESVQLRWVNLSDVGGNEWLEVRSQSGPGYRRWNGRQKWHLGDWEMTVDRRPDLGKVLGGLKESGGYAVTHLATLCRTDGQSFTASEVPPVLRAYHLTVSFALGREASPSLVVATNADGTVVWREWSVRRADPIGGVTPWWHIAASPMDEVTRLVGARLLDSQWGRNATHILQGYILSKRGGFVEQRITVCYSTIEQLCWQRNVLEGGVDAEKYDKKKSAQRLRGMLSDAKVPLDVSKHLAVLQQFALDGNDKGPFDGPAAVTAVRHRLTHPRSAEDIYDRPGLVVETWLLLDHYLELLVLHWVRYTGKLQDTSIIDGWSGDVSPVSWAQAASSSVAC